MGDVDNKKTRYLSMLEVQGAGGTQEGLENWRVSAPEMGDKQRPKELCRNGPEDGGCSGKFRLAVDF